jgi:hypothetical protein
VVNGSYAYVANGFNGLRILDISEPSQIVEIASYPTQSIATSLQIVNDTLFLLDSSEGLRIFTLAGPTELVAAGSYTTLGIVTKVISCNANIFLIAGWDHGVHWLEKATLDKLQADVHHVFKADVTDIVVVDDIAYVLAGYAGFRIYDLSLPAAPVSLGSLPILSTNIYVAGAYAYTSDLDGNLLIIDVSDKSAPAVVRSYPKFGFADTMEVDGELGALYTPGQEVAIIQVAANGELSVRDRVAVPRPVEGTAVHDGMAYLAIGKAGLAIIDISDPDEASLITVYDTAGVARDVAVQDGFAFIADGDGGVLVVDVVDPRSPQLVAHYQTVGRAIALDLAGDQIYVANQFGGMVVLKFHAPTRSVSVSK